MIPAGKIIATDYALFIDGLLVPVKWDGSTLPIHPDDLGNAEPNCFCDQWLVTKNRVLKPSTIQGSEQLTLVPYNYDGTFAEQGWKYSSGRPPTDLAYPVWSTVFNLNGIRGSASDLCVAETPFNFVYRDGGIAPRNSHVSVYSDLALTTTVARVDFMDAGANCMDATIVDGGLVAVVGERWSGQRAQAWRVLRLTAGRVQVDALPDADLCFPFKSENTLGSLRFACHLGPQVSEWLVDTNASRRTLQFMLPEAWTLAAALSDTSTSVLAVSHDAGTIAVCDEFGCRTLTEYTPGFISVGMEADDSLLLARQQADGGIGVTRYPAKRWRR